MTEENEAVKILSEHIIRTINKRLEPIERKINSKNNANQKDTDLSNYYTKQDIDNQYAVLKNAIDELISKIEQLQRL